ncbi:MAG: DUF6305 family protein [Candidatus Aminicenantes bacterium]|nr:DUF6305 family protein [Candidatus Aminicenantes bacterium]
MKTIFRICSLLFLVFLLGANSYFLGAGQAQAPKASPPILLTACGQSPDTSTMKVVIQKSKIPYDLVELATVQDLANKKSSGTPYKTIIILMGASLKGMGAAGISIEDEIKRTSELIDAARRDKIMVIGAHIGGMKRRAQGAAVGDNTDELSIDAVAPKSDLLLVLKEGNEDGRFTVIAKQKKIPMIEVEKNLDLIPEIEKLFK